MKNFRALECWSRAKLRLLIICSVEVKIRYPMDTCVYCCWPKTGYFVDGSFIECISLLVLQDQNDSLRRRANSQFAGKQFVCRPVVGQVTVKS